ncbi:serine/threonine-protein kinase [Actinomadura sp. NPDC047616]|uniref:serine/threonine-protein kinase n=1 Tax=Actinomadura sp. NPDC047616 TaxID=3155914 RepID=UPI0033FACF19
MTRGSEPPTVIGERYELVEKLTPGGMGQVWRGYDTVLDRPVAVKQILPDKIETPEQATVFAERFRREARVTARINHPGVPQVYDAVLDDESAGNLYLVMELVSGTALKAFVRPDHRLPVAWAVSVIAQVCTVLSYAHAIPAVHRDIKPGNIMVADDGTVKLLDFGVTAILRSDVTRLTEEGTYVGTLRYMAPEQIKGAQISPRADLYATGCVLYELLVGEPFNLGATPPQQMYQHLSKDPTPVRELRPDVPEPLERLILQLLEKNPEQRPADAQEVYERLLPFLPDRGETGVAPGELPPDDVPDPTRPYRTPLAPLARTRAAEPEPVTQTQTQPVSATDPTGVRDAIEAAFAEAERLLDEERFSQAADVLDAAVEQAAPVVGPENPRVLELRKFRAVALNLGENYRRAAPEFERLATAYARTRGPLDEDALACRRQAAYSRAQLGESTAALRQFEEALDGYRAALGDGADEVLAIRRDIIMLMLAERRIDEVLPPLRELYQDMYVLKGPGDPDTVEIGDLLDRLEETAEDG